MTYKAKRTDKITDVIELCDESGNAKERLSIVLDADIVGRDLLLHWERLRKLTEKLKAAQSSSDNMEFCNIVGAYTKCVDVLFTMVFGEANRLKIYEFFEGSYLEMVQQLVPYIFKRVIPAVKASVNAHKKELKQAFNIRYE